MSESEGQGKMTFEPLFNGGLKGIHPAIGIIENMAYVGQSIRMKITLPSPLPDGRKEEQRDVLCLITNDHQLITTDPQTLREHGWELAYKPIHSRTSFPPWMLSDIELFLRETEPINALSVYREVLKPFEIYMDFSTEDTYVLYALWAIGTMFHQLFNAYPYLYIGGTKGSGKTKLLTLLSFICFNAISSGNVSTASVFRLVQNLHCSLMMDETEKLGFINYKQGLTDSAREFRNLLLNGYKKGMPVYRTEKNTKEQFVAQPFDTYSPKAIANIAGLDDILEDRAISSFLLKAKDVEKSNSDPQFTDECWGLLRNKLYRLYLDYWHEVQAAYQELSELRGKALVQFLQNLCPEAKLEDLQKIIGRQLEIWKPLLALARFFDKQDVDSNLLQTVVKIAVRNVNQKIGENLTETADMVLVETLERMVSVPSWVDDFKAVKDVRTIMADSYDDEQRWLTTDWVGRALRRLGFLDKRRLGSQRQIRLSKQCVLDLAARHGIRGENSIQQKIEQIGGVSEREGDSVQASQVSKASQVAAISDTSQESQESQASLDKIPSDATSDTCATSDGCRDKPDNSQKSSDWPVGGNR
jgi:hypothetical protein